MLNQTNGSSSSVFYFYSGQTAANGKPDGDNAAPSIKANKIKPRLYFWGDGIPYLFPKW